MPKVSIRSRRVADLLQSEVALILQREINDPRLTDVSLVTVKMSPDLRQAKIYYTLLNPENLLEVESGLAKASGFIRRAVAQRLDLRYMPKLFFKFDDTEIRADNLQKLINQGLGDENSSAG
ncbi:MAG: 30S ribosome-binding factor RbfA [Gammaproteobacteria bacterium]|nr:30S ribosome-binding factor RbfA [Gammaproteobacteria bacterium]